MEVRRARACRRSTTGGVSTAPALSLAGTIILGRSGTLATGLPTFVLRVGAWTIAATFAARTIGEFHYVGLFRRMTGTPFATWDTWLFTPLCAALAAASAAIAAS